MKWTLFCLLTISQAHATCLNMVKASWRLNASEKTVSLVNFAPQAIKVCQEDKALTRFVMEIKKNNHTHVQTIELPPLPKNEDLKKSSIDIYFEAPLPLWAKKSQLKITEPSTGEVIATGEMK